MPKWSDVEEQLLAEKAALGSEALASLLGRTVSAVCSRACVLRIPLGRRDRSRQLQQSPLRFMENVEFDPFGGCWLWSAYHNQAGYGTTKGNRRQVLAHRLSFRLFRGNIPEGALVCHRCDVRACVNPNHLFLGSHLDNVRDMVAKGRARSGNIVIDEATARRIVALLDAGVGPSAAADRVGCSRSIARNIAYGVSWTAISGRRWVKQAA